MSFRHAVTALVFLASLRCSGFDSTAFQPASLAAWQRSLLQSGQFSQSTPGYMFDSQFPKLLTTVEFTGHVRALSKEKTEFLLAFTRTVGKTELLAAYRSEFEVREAGKSYWILVQKAKLDALSKSVKPGVRFKLYHRFAGVAQGRVFFYLMTDLSVSGR